MNSYTQFLQLITRAKEKQFTGRIIFQASSQVQWQLYFFEGQVVWLNGGFLPHRSWLRYLRKYALSLNCDRLSAKEYHQLEFFPTASFTALSQRNLLEGVSLNEMLNHRTQENFFDLLQTGSSQSLQVKLASGLDNNFAVEKLQQYWTLPDSEELIFKAQNSLNSCSVHGGCWSLNLAPKIIKTNKTLDCNSSIISDKLNYLFDGQSTIRDLAFKLNRDAIQLSFSLLPYIRKGWIELVEVTDIALESNLTANKTNNHQSFLTINKQASKPLIYYVDDNSLNCYLMENIVNNFGYKCLSNQQARSAIGQLLKVKPDLIFLDIIMPEINGYTLCKSIKTISSLKHIPIIMLTGEDSLSAQIKARSYGADGYVRKPIIQEKIISVINQYLFKTEVTTTY